MRERLANLRFPEMAVLFSGTVSMGLEIVAGRLLAPEYGSSVYTWGSILGIFMASLSLGYYIGGRRSDGVSRNSISRIMLTASVYIAFLMLFAETLIHATEIIPLGARYSSIPAIVVLFGPPAFILGLISPYTAQLSEKNSKGEASGRTFAFGTVGSIIGSFATTFLLIPSLEINTIFLVFGGLLITGAVIFSDFKMKGLSLFMVLILAGSYGMAQSDVSVGNEVVVQTQTPYQELKVVDNNGIRTMYLNGVPNSAMYLNRSTQHVFEYTRYFHLPLLMTDDVDRVLFIGGGGFTGPKRFVNDYDHEVDVVEIDPEVVSAAKEYFYVRESSDLKIHVADGREYLEQTNKTYDLIVLDAFKRDEVPFHLTTQEFMELTYSRLDEDGVLMSNLIAAPSGSGSKFFRSEYRTMNTVYPNVYSFPTSNGFTVQNVEVVATKEGNFTEEELLRRNRERDIGINLSNEIRSYDPKVRTSDVPILTDEYAPVDSLLGATDKEYVLEGEKKIE